MLVYQSEHVGQEIVRAHEEAHKRVDRESHDQIIQALIGLNYHLADMRAHPGKDMEVRIAQLRARIHQVLDDVHRFCLDNRLQTADTHAGHQPKIRVVVADDHPIVRVGIMSELSRHPDIEVCGEAVDGDEAVQLVQMIASDVLILDVDMPGQQTLEVLRRVGASPMPPRTLILTIHADPACALAMLKAGAKGYLLKDEEPAAITAAVRAIMRGKTRLSAAVMAGVVDCTVRDSAEPGMTRLSQRETAVLHLLGEGQHNQEIGVALGISERTVRYHLRNIYDKLGVQRRGEAIAWAVRSRYAGPRV